MRVIAFILVIIVVLGIYAYNYESNKEIKELYRITDIMIKKLKNKDYEFSYNSRDLNTKSTPDQTYKVIPRGGFISVYINKEEDDDKLKELSSKLAEMHRKNDAVDVIRVSFGAVRIVGYSI